MINIGIVCHSSNMADEIIKFVELFKSSDFKIVNLGKNNTLSFGTLSTEIMNNLLKYDNGNPFLIFTDIGSSITNTKEAINLLKGKMEIKLADAPLIEGLIVAVTANEENMSIDELELITKESLLMRKN